MQSLFVCDPRDLYAEIHGGVQICSQEFLSVVEAASDSVDLCEINICRKSSWRVRRRLQLGSYLFYHPTEVRPILEKAVLHKTYTNVFINRSELLRITPLIRELLPTSRIIVMSHGNQSGDDLYELSGESGRRNSGIRRLAALWKIGQDLGTESWYRHRYIDVVCVMSREEEIIERWLGAKSTIVLPRILNHTPMKWSPKPGRVGFVGTLNHTPNFVALEKICEEISKNDYANLKMRIVGQPESCGQELALKYKFVDYLGPLSNSALQSEVCSWNLFLNPIFWLSRGASMKLGQAISWGIPFLTTQSGSRGYEISNLESLITLDDPRLYVSRLFELLELLKEPQKTKELLVKIKTHSSNIEDLAERLSVACKAKLL